MTFTTWLVFLLMEIALCLTPGPAVLFVFAHGLRYGGAKSLWANLGVLTANAFYFAVSATGLGVLVQTSHQAFTIVKYAGAAYLVYLGLRMIFSRADAFGDSEKAPEVTGKRLLARGFVLQAANPKALIFFIALLPQFVKPEHGIAMQMLILGVTSTVAEFFVLAMYGYLAARIALWVKSSRAARWMDRGAGTMLVACGAGLAMTSDS